MTKAKKVYMYDMQGNLVMEFKTTRECADYFGKEKDYINFNIKYYKRFRYNDQWYRLSRDKK